MVVGAFKASLAELLLDHLYRLVLADAGRNHNPLLLQLVINEILRLPLYVFDHVVICHAPNAFTGRFKPPGRSDRLTDPNHPRNEAKKGTENVAEKPAIPRAPRGLGKAGKEVWRSVHTVFDFEAEPHLLAILEQACRTRDEIDRLEAAMEGQPYTVLGSAKQVQVHPLVAEAGFQRKALAELLSRISLPDNGDPDDPQARRSAAARKAARTRWNRGY